VLFLIAIFPTIPLIPYEIEEKKIIILPNKVDSVSSRPVWTTSVIEETIATNNPIILRIFFDSFKKVKAIITVNTGATVVISAAIDELNLSMDQSASNRAQQYLSEIEAGSHPEAKEPQEKKPTDTDLTAAAAVPAVVTPEEVTSSEIIGDRMSIAVLPFDSKGLGNELGSIDLLDKLITGFVNLNRFKVIERALLEKILEEQKLGMSGIVDVSTAAEIGKGIGVDAVIVGSVTRASNAMSIDARLIDTETAAILTAKDAYSQRISLQDVSNMVSILADKIKNELPILNGYVINVSEKKVTLDIGRSNGLKKGMKCHVYREGAPIVHPVTGKVIAKEIQELCEVQVTEVFDVYANAVIIQNKSGFPKVRDRIVTK